MFKLNSCASSPCLTDLLRSSIKQGSQETVYDPVTKLGTVSQLYLQIVSPRGSTEAPEMCVKRRNLSISDSEASSDSGVAFRGSLDDEGEDDLDLPLGAISRTHTMPDLSSISCTQVIYSLNVQFGLNGTANGERLNSTRIAGICIYLEIALRHFRFFFIIIMPPLVHVESRVILHSTCLFVDGISFFCVSS